MGSYPAAMPSSSSSSSSPAGSAEPLYSASPARFTLRSFSAAWSSSSSSSPESCSLSLTTKSSFSLYSLSSSSSSSSPASIECTTLVVRDSRSWRSSSWASFASCFRLAFSISLCAFSTSLAFSSGSSVVTIVLIFFDFLYRMLDCSVLARILCALELVDDGSTWIDLSNSCTGTYRSPCSITNKSSSFFLTRISKYSSPIFNDMEPSSHSTMDEFDCLYSSSEAVLAYLHLIVFWISSFLNSSESCNSLLVLVLCESCTNSLSPDSNVAGANGSGSTNRYRGKLNPIAPPSGTCDRGCLGNETSSWVGWYSSSATSSSSSSSILVSSATSTPVASAASLSSPKRSSTASAGESPVFSNSSLLMNKIKGL